MAKAKSQGRENIKLQSTASKFFYSTSKNKRNTEQKLEIKKYDPIIKKHVIFKEAKLKS